jgi:poly-gamma-glutamate synthase PgsB/CapB
VLLFIFFLMAACFVAVLLLGAAESRVNRKNTARLKIRVSVNGIRGKSTATRLITAILHEAGIVAVGKTTGTAARYIVPAENAEEPIARRAEGPNIKEQLSIIKRAARSGAQALVCECMAIRPEYQNTCQNSIFKATLSVIVNVLEDHLDVMGPTLNEIAIAFSRTIPYNGYLVTIDSPFTPYFRQIAEERGTQVFVADNATIPEGYIERFEYLLFPENVSLGLAAARALGISDEVALRGMLNAAPDPGALRVSYLDGKLWSGSVFVNGFAANEPQSSLIIWEKLKEMDFPFSLSNPIVLFNGRPDRIDRTKQFVRDFFPQLQDMTLVVMGQRVKLIGQAFRDGKFPGVVDYIDLEEKSPAQVAERLRTLAKNRLIFGVGNIHGDAEALVELLLERASEETPVPLELAATH